MPKSTKAGKTVAVRNINLRGKTNRSGASKTRVNEQRYEAMKRALLKAVPRDKVGIEFRSLPETVRPHLPDGQLPGGGSLMWYVTTVKLDLEARGLLERVPGSRPQRIRRT